ncbi:hypothetical protein [Burkholderia diffusa]|uniref:hypothetical protein n=1 Tax=Burkholderia diffusa TaxID=488732 RepID=UPI0007585827|nr:hypothetical protein [Burkholderia diffusa]KVG34907.1 hypothetical protein WJ30_00010 [Burkholderia diffusa]
MSVSTVSDNVASIAIDCKEEIAISLEDLFAEWIALEVVLPWIFRAELQLCSCKDLKGMV